MPPVKLQFWFESIRYLIIMSSDYNKDLIHDNQLKEIMQHESCYKLFTRNKEIIVMLIHQRF